MNTLFRVTLVCLVAVTTLAGWFYYQASSYSAKIGFLLQEKAKLEQTYQTELLKAQSALQSQNQAIEIYQADLDRIQSVISAKQQELTANWKEQETKILKELSRDSSSDNQLKLTDRILHDFTKD